MLLEYRPLVPLGGGRHHRGSVAQNEAAGLSQGRDPVLMASLPDLSPTLERRIVHSATAGECRTTPAISRAGA